MIDDYRKGWALRYIREAKADLREAHRTMGADPSLLMEALRKTQAAVYYSLGDPVSIESIVQQNLYEDDRIKNSILRYLVEIEKSIRLMAQLPSSIDEKMLKEVEEIFKTATEIVTLFTEN